ncbi:MAG: hypothetical protein GY765_01990, partial [bacterium]|nr:hypothetical protein [bacterium]
DNVAGNIEKSEDEVVAPSRVIEGMSFLLGVIKLDDGIMIIPDLEKILTVGEEKILSKAITKKSGKSVTKKGISKK